MLEPMLETIVPPIGGAETLYGTVRNFGRTRTASYGLNGRVKTPTLWHYL